MNAANFIDHSANLGNAKIEGLEKDLKMTGTDYNVANMMFFIPYILLEVPANTILMKFKRPSLWIGFIVTAWGIVMTCTGFVKNWTGLLICRVLLGIFEYVYASQLRQSSQADTRTEQASSRVQSFYSPNGTLPICFSYAWLFSTALQPCRVHSLVSSPLASQRCVA